MTLLYSKMKRNHMKKMILPNNRNHCNSEFSQSVISNVLLSDDQH